MMWVSTLTRSVDTLVVIASKKVHRSPLLYNFHHIVEMYTKVQVRQTAGKNLRLVVP